METSPEGQKARKWYEPAPSVWQRTQGRDEITASTFNLIFAMSTIYGLAVYGRFALLFLDAQLGLWSVLGLMAIAVAGAPVAASQNPWANVLGLTMTAGGFGSITGLILSEYNLTSVIDIATATILVSVVIGTVGWLLPRSLEHWAGLLLVGLFALNTAYVLLPWVAITAPVDALSQRLEWAGIALFSAYLLFDFNRAQHVPKTVHNAMDCGMAVFLDVINVFIRLLSLYGEAKRNER